MIIIDINTCYDVIVVGGGHSGTEAADEAGIKFRILNSSKRPEIVVIKCAEHDPKFPG